MTGYLNDSILSGKDVSIGQVKLGPKSLSEPSDCNSNSEHDEIDCESVVMDEYYDMSSNEDATEPANRGKQKALVMFSLIGCGAVVVLVTLSFVSYLAIRKCNTKKGESTDLS